MANTTFRAQLTAAVAEAFRELRRRIGDERLYAFALYTSGEDDFGYVCASGNSQERLENEGVRWSAPDWAYHDFSEAVSRIELPPGSSAERDAAVYEDMVAALSSLRRKAKGVMLLILCGDMSEEFFRRGLDRLNPKSIVEAYVREHTPEPFFEAFEAAHVADRVAAWVDLWRDLVLDRSSRSADEARRFGARQYDVADRLPRLGPALVPLLIDLIEKNVLAPAFNEKGSEAWGRHGAFTVESSLATSAAFLVGQCDLVSDAEVERLQHILGTRVAADRDLATASTLAENIARVLHHLRPKRFPNSELAPHTNHLRNPEPFLAKQPNRPD